jgi:hypothetical protein
MIGSGRAGPGAAIIPGVAISLCPTHCSFGRHIHAVVALLHVAQFGGADNGRDRHMIPLVDSINLGRWHFHEFRAIRAFLRVKRLSRRSELSELGLGLRVAVLMQLVRG